MSIIYSAIIILIIATIFLAIQLIRKKTKLFSISFLLTLFIGIIAPGLIVIYFLFGLSCIDGCHVKKHTPKWFFTMNRSAIGNLPVIKPINKVEFYYNTDLGERWQVKYESKSQLNEIQREIENYLTNKKMMPNSQISCYNGYWVMNEKTIRKRYESRNNCVMIYLISKPLITKSHKENQSLIKCRRNQINFLSIKTLSLARSRATAGNVTNFSLKKNVYHYF